MQYLYRYKDAGNVIKSGTTHNINRLYRRCFPNIYEPNNTINWYCLRNEKFYTDLILEYIPCFSLETASEALKHIDSLTDWQVYISPTKTDDINRYKEKLENRIIFLKDQAKRDSKLHEFLINNFNSPDEFSIYKETFKKPEGWDTFKKSEKVKYVTQHIDVDKKYELSSRFYINVFTDFELDEDDTNVIINERIDSKMIPYLVVSIYNTLIYTSHDLNIVLKSLGEAPVMVMSEDIPYYNAIKPLMSKYTKEEYVKNIGL